MTQQQNKHTPTTYSPPFSLFFEYKICSFHAELNIKREKKKEK